ncbi:aminotransferase class IV [Mangrovibacterium lignilyticum]|uniref:aminotransferase class IV n=1 Tax=Mangrovibacterium lignilyticum TaxID=2668052 RepID=UPI0013D3FA41|nr:aminotransferase class IV [Mangrovibacterium lignilyticum]
MPDSSTNIKYYLENGNPKILPLPELMEKPALQIYEVLRVIDGIALFEEDHFARYFNSCSILHVSTFVSAKKFSEQIAALISLNQLAEGNIRVELNTGASGEQHVRMFVFPHQYPTSHQYQMGVKVGLLRAVRENPKVKLVQQSVRDRASQAMLENKWFEVLLVDHDSCITEGSRSNVFFVREGAFYTSPGNKVLSGITRKKIMECINTLGMHCFELDIKEDELDSFEAAFISGTSPKILPIASVQSIAYQVNHPSMRQLMHEFDQMILAYVEERKTP